MTFALYVDYPSNWDHMEVGEVVKLFLLDPETESDEYERVTNEFLQTLPNVEILRVQRVQNKILWERYLHCSKMIRKLDKPHLGEMLLFHGTKQNSPELIYTGTEGFDMRFSANGMWGRGNYFAVNSSYSNCYAFCTQDGNRKMFAAWVLTGSSFHSNSNPNLTKPPFLEESASSSTSVRRRYDSVSGTTGGTRVYITYDNEHAYPAYLITYKN